jgi:lipopolysaccharide/colanic/teichoic acid biosynthesis glycosyltransferase
MQVKMFSPKGRSRILKRFLDLALSAIGLICLSPVFAGIAIVILLDDGRPVLFSQARVGRNGKLFRLWKFRTMRSGSQGALITAQGDRRVARAGAKLRRLKLDELPQLLNVLKGDMSLVGPRPEVPRYVFLEAPVWQTILKVRPGITDLATLLYRDEETILSAAADPERFYIESVLPAKLRLNVGYLLSSSFRQDLRLILLTIRYSLFPKGFNPDLVKRTFVTGAVNG